MNGAEHTLSIRVQNVPGVLARIAGALSESGHNIETLTVGKTHRPGISKIVLSVPAGRPEMDRLCARINDMAEVVSAELLDRPRSLLQEVCLLRIGFVTNEARMRIMAAAQPYRPIVRGVDERSVLLEVADVPGLLDDFVARMSEFEILDTSRTGMTALGPRLAPLDET
jgi:acetolactate synthase-1/3 small subunit